MAGEVTSSVSIAYNDGLQNGNLGVVSRLLTSAGKRFTKLVQNVGITPEAIQLGEITAPGAFIFINLDDVNFIEILDATGGDVVAKLKPDTLGDGTGGWFAGDCAGSDMQAPFAQADTDPCRLAVLVVDV